MFEIKICLIHKKTRLSFFFNDYFCNPKILNRVIVIICLLVGKMIKSCISYIIYGKIFYFSILYFNL